MFTVYLAVCGTEKSTFWVSQDVRLAILALVLASSTTISVPIITFQQFWCYEYRRFEDVELATRIDVWAKYILIRHRFLAHLNVLNRMQCVR